MALVALLFLCVVLGGLIGAAYAFFFPGAGSLAPPVATGSSVAAERLRTAPTPGVQNPESGALVRNELAALLNRGGVWTCVDVHGPLPAFVGRVMYQLRCSNGNVLSVITEGVEEVVVGATITFVSREGDMPYQNPTLGQFLRIQLQDPPPKQTQPSPPPDTKPSV